MFDQRDKSGACVVIMLSGNANVNVTDMDNTNVTPLHLAIQQDNEKAVAALTQFRHCDVNLQVRYPSLFGFPRETGS